MSPQPQNSPPRTDSWTRLTPADTSDHPRRTGPRNRTTCMCSRTQPDRSARHGRWPRFGCRSPAGKSSPRWRSSRHSRYHQHTRSRPGTAGHTVSIMTSKRRVRTTNNTRACIWSRTHTRKPHLRHTRVPRSDAGQHPHSAYTVRAHLHAVRVRAALMTVETSNASARSAAGAAVRHAPAPAAVIAHRTGGRVWGGRRRRAPAPWGAAGPRAGAVRVVASPRGGAVKSGGTRRGRRAWRATRTPVARSGASHRLRCTAEAVVAHRTLRAAPLRAARAAVRARRGGAGRR